MPFPHLLVNKCLVLSFEPAELSLQVPDSLAFLVDEIDSNEELLLQDYMKKTSVNIQNPNNSCKVS